MFRSMCKSYRLLNGLAIPFYHRPATAADDVTKVATGILHRYTQKESHYTAQFSQTPRWCCVPNCSGVHHLSDTFSLSNSILSNVNSLAVYHPTSAFPFSTSVLRVNYSTTNKQDDSKPGPAKPETVSGSLPGKEETPVPEEKLSIFQRFKRAYKEHGKILVGVHVVTSTVWITSFYLLASGGVDIVPWMEHWGFSDMMIKPFRAGGLGDLAVAYLMYKLATPARYTVTLAGTNLVIRYLRRKGRMAPQSQGESLREFYKEGRQKFKDSKLRQDRLKKLRAARERKKAEKARKSKKTTR